ncbi:RNA-binding domain-containing protein [Methanococcus sp. CF]
MIIKIKTKVKPTEDENKVLKAVTNIFNNAEMELAENIYSGVSKDISRFKELLRSQAILDAARNVLERNIVGNATKFYINKQAAYSGILNFDKDVHGGIKLEFICEENEDILGLIKDIAPRTRNGVIINEDEEVEHKKE